MACYHSFQLFLDFRTFEINFTSEKCYVGNIIYIPIILLSRTTHLGYEILKSVPRQRFQMNFIVLIKGRYLENFPKYYFYSFHIYGIYFYVRLFDSYVYLHPLEEIALYLVMLGVILSILMTFFPEYNFQWSLYLQTK